MSAYYFVRFTTFRMSPSHLNAATGNLYIRQSMPDRYTPMIPLHGTFSAEWFLQEHPQWSELQKTWKLPMAGNVAMSDSLSKH